MSLATPITPLTLTLGSGNTPPLLVNYVTKMAWELCHVPGSIVLELFTAAAARLTEISD